MRTCILLFLALAFPQVALGGQLMFPAPRGATDVSHVVLIPGIGEEDHFFFAERYPGISAIDHYVRVFSNWRPCYWQEKGWNAFGDMSNGTEHFVHRYVRHWVDRSNTLAVSVIATYTSPGIHDRVRPNNDRQFVAVVRYKVPDAVVEMKRIGAVCEPRK